MLKNEGAFLANMGQMNEQLGSIASALESVAQAIEGLSMNGVQGDVEKGGALIAAAISSSMETLSAEVANLVINLPSSEH